MKCKFYMVLVDGLYVSHGSILHNEECYQPYVDYMKSPDRTCLHDPVWAKSFIKQFKYEDPHHKFELIPVVAEVDLKVRPGAKVWKKVPLPKYMLENG